MVVDSERESLEALAIVELGVAIDHCIAGNPSALLAAKGESALTIDDPGLQLVLDARDRQTFMPADLSQVLVDESLDMCYQRIP